MASSVAAMPPRYLRSSSRSADDGTAADVRAYAGSCDVDKLQTYAQSLHVAYRSLHVISIATNNDSMTADIAI